MFQFVKHPAVRFLTGVLFHVAGMFAVIYSIAYAYRPTLIDSNQLMRTSDMAQPPGVFSNWRLLLLDVLANRTAATMILAALFMTILSASADRQKLGLFFWISPEFSCWRVCSFIPFLFQTAAILLFWRTRHWSAFCRIHSKR